MSVFLMYSVNECEIKFCLKFKIQIKLSFVLFFHLMLQIPWLRQSLHLMLMNQEISILRLLIAS